MEIRPNPAKRKRGKPNVYVRHFGFESGEVVRKGYEYMWHEYKPKSRSISNLFYILEGNSFAEEHLTPELYQFAFRRKETGELWNKVILEQLGRALQQNHLPDEDCQKLMHRAIDRLKDGYPCAWVVRYLRDMRNDLASKQQ